LSLLLSGKFGLHGSAGATSPVATRSAIHVRWWQRALCIRGLRTKKSDASKRDQRERPSGNSIRVFQDPPKRPLRGTFVLLEGTGDDITRRQGIRCAPASTRRWPAVPPIGCSCPSQTGARISGLQVA